MQYFERQGEDLDTGGLSLDAYGAEIYLDNLTGRLTYAMAHRMLGELGKFLMGGYRCAARFELWETQGAQAEQLSVGWLEPEDTNKNAKVDTEEAAKMIIDIDERPVWLACTQHPSQTLPVIIP